MNPMQQMLAQAQRMQRELDKAREALAEKDFTIAKGGMVEVTMKGDRSIAAIKIEPEALDADNKEMLEETLAMAINELMDQVNDELDAVEEKVTGRKGIF